jgi:hypothetical protein
MEVLHQTQVTQERVVVVELVVLDQMELVLQRQGDLVEQLHQAQYLAVQFFILVVEVELVDGGVDQVLDLLVVDLIQEDLVEVDQLVHKEQGVFQEMVVVEVELKVSVVLDLVILVVGV